MKAVKALSAIALAAAAASSQAMVVFSDDFDGNGVGENLIPAGWVTLFGTTDILGTGYAGGLCAAAGLPISGNCVDLDGTSADAGILLQTSIAVTAGMTYTASFDLAGSQRDSIVGQTIRGITYTTAMVDNTVNVQFGSASGSWFLDAAQGATTYSLSFTAGSTGSVVLAFENVGGDNVGALLDNVVVTAVPEPETLAMMLAGLGLIGFLQRRRG